MSIRFTAIELSGGSTHQHIVRLWWVNPVSNESGNNTRGQLVGWVEQGGVAYVQDAFGSRVAVGVVTPATGSKYLRTHADGKWTNNLLALPRRRSEVARRYTA